MTEGDIHHFMAQAKMALISEEFFGECFDFDHLFASCLGGLVLKNQQKRLFLVQGKIFHLVNPLQHQDVFSNDLTG